MHVRYDAQSAGRGKGGDEAISEKARTLMTPAEDPWKETDSNRRFSGDEGRRGAGVGGEAPWRVVQEVVQERAAPC